MLLACISVYVLSTLVRQRERAHSTHALFPGTKDQSGMPPTPPEEQA